MPPLSASATAHIANFFFEALLMVIFISSVLMLELN
jgi:hypothetical protein